MPLPIKSAKKLITSYFKGFCKKSPKPEPTGHIPYAEEVPVEKLPTELDIIASDLMKIVSVNRPCPYYIIPKCDCVVMQAARFQTEESVIKLLEWISAIPVNIKIIAVDPRDRAFVKASLFGPLPHNTSIVLNNFEKFQHEIRIEQTKIAGAPWASIQGLFNVYLHEEQFHFQVWKRVILQ